MDSNARNVPSAAEQVTDRPAGIDDFRRQVDVIRTRAQQITQGLDDEAFQWRPGPGRWSMAECFEHLNVTMELYLPPTIRAIETARARGWRSSEPARLRWFGRWFVGLTEPPPKRAFRAPGAFSPQNVQPLSEALNRFLRLRGEWSECMRDADGLDLCRAKLRSPALPLLRFSLAETFAIVAAHDRRHLWQAEQVRQLGQFPR